MQQEALGPVPTAYAERLLQWLGPDARGWISNAPARIQAAADRWHAVPVAYHDAGATSVKVVARADGRPLMLKTWYDQAQGVSEVRALRLWADGPAVRVVAYDEELGVAALELIGARPGGSDRPQASAEMVAAGLTHLHRLGAGARHLGFTTLRAHAQTTLLPGLEGSMARIDLGTLSKPVTTALKTADLLIERPHDPMLLHGNLYRDHILVRPDGRPCFIDPTALVGDPVYDWASWVVLYDREAGQQDRFDAAVRRADVDPAALAHWATLIAADELAFRIETSSSGIDAAAEALRMVTDRGKQLVRSRPATVRPPNSTRNLF